MRAYWIVTAFFVALASIATIEGRPRQESAQTTIEAFCQLDREGQQLTPDGWQRIASLFVEPGRRNVVEIRVVDEVSVSPSSTTGEGRAAVKVVYTLVGFLDVKSARLTSGSAAGLQGYEEFSLVQSASSSRVEELGGRPNRAQWRIEGRVPQPHVSIDAAMRYVTALREGTGDPTTRANADQTLKTLQRHRRHRGQ
jgi:hypothetical protein